MTAEERMAYFQGIKHRNNSYPVRSAVKNTELIFLKIKFFISVILFIVFLSMDYTGYKVHGIGAEEIITEVTEDMKLQIPEGIDAAL